LSNHEGNFTFKDNTNGKSYSLSVKQKYSPDTLSVEWIGEDPLGQYVLPAFSSANFENMLSPEGNLISPVTAVALVPLYWQLSNGNTLVQNAFPAEIQSGTNGAVIYSSS